MSPYQRGYQAALLEFATFAESLSTSIAAVEGSGSLSRVGIGVSADTWHNAAQKAREMAQAPPEDPNPSILAQGGHRLQVVTIGVESIPVDELGLSTRAENMLSNAGIETIGQLVTYSASDLLRLKNCGRVYLSQIEQSLKLLGIKLKEEG